MGLNIFKKATTIDFVGMRYFAYGLSVLVLLLGIGGIFVQGGLHYGVDFAGGVMVQVQFVQPMADEQVKSALAPLNLPGLIVQKYGNTDVDYMLRFSSTQSVGEELRAGIVTALSSPENPMEITRVEMVGPKVGEDLRNMALEAMLYAVLLTTVYISGRFERRWFIAAGMAAVLGAGVYLFSLLGLGRMWDVCIALIMTMILCYKLKLNFALGAIISLVHDVVVTVGLLTIMGKEIDLNIIAALLTLIGYSLNDNIIIYDRIRENLQGYRSDEANLPDMGEIINLSANQTLSRTILTSGSTLIACLSLYLLGGTVINDFALTMLIGIVIGTFSSVFVAAPVLLALGDSKSYIMLQEDVTAELEKPGEHGIV